MSNSQSSRIALTVQGCVRRFIQVPVNVGMPEAWQGSGHTWSELATPGGTPGNGSVLQAAARLGVGVFGSAPLHEGQLLRNSQLVVGPCC